MRGTSPLILMQLQITNKLPSGSKFFPSRVDSFSEGTIKCPESKNNVNKIKYKTVSEEIADDIFRTLCVS